MKLFRVSEEKAAPNWTFASDSLDQYEKEDAINVDQINLTDEADVSDETLCEECGKIEQCASGGNNYYYNSSWQKGHVSHLKEYALACGMDISKFKSVSATAISKYSQDSFGATKTIETKLSPSEFREKLEEKGVKIISEEKVDDKTVFTVEASDQTMVKTASTESEQTSGLQDVWKDPFNIEERADTSHLDKAEWEITSKASKIDDVPTMSGINAIRGGEDYSLNIEASLPINQNSISNPLAIEQLAESDDITVDTGMRLRQEATDREEAKKQDVADWEQGKIDAMEHKDIVPEGHVFQTAPEVAHTGIGTKASQMANIDAKDIPEFTQGEMLAQAQIDHKASIQRPKAKEERTSDGKSAYRSISSDFSDALSSALGK